MAQPVSSYLSQYAAPNVLTYAGHLQHGIAAVLVVPVFDEALAPLLAMVRHPDAQPRAIILVFNAPRTADKAALERTREVLARLQDEFEFTCDGHLLTASVRPQQSLLVLDFTADADLFDAKKGVGLARKIGLDLALALSQRSAELFACPVAWLHSTDADVLLPDDYFTLPELPETVSALVYPHVHRAEAGLELATALYQLRLDLYTESLRAAGSPYAYHTIGSTLAVRPLVYAQVRGMPQRSAGEDFYLLNKVAKLGQVVTPACAPIELAGRFSDRVPFGTGPALRLIAQMSDPVSTYLYYPPAAFHALRGLLSAVDQWALPEKTDQPRVEVSFIASLNAHLAPAEVEAVMAALNAAGLTRFTAHVAKQSPKVLSRGFHDWFDAFRTLKFIHYLRDHVYPACNLQALWQQRASVPQTLWPAIQALRSTNITSESV